MKHDELETAVPPVPPKQKRGIWWVVKWSLVLFLLLVFALVALNFRLLPGPDSPLVRVSPETTWITEPLKPNGDVDYMAYLNQQNSAGVKPEENAFVDLVRIVGPIPDGKLVPKQFFDLLGIKTPSERADYFREPFQGQKYDDESVWATVGGVELNWEGALGLTSSVPFDIKDFPELGHWYETSRNHLDAMRVAVAKPSYYMPYVGETLSESKFPVLHATRNLARGLHRSSMIRMGQGDVSGAIDDQLAILRLGRVVGSQGSPLELLLSLQISGIARNAIAQTVFGGDCGADDLERLATIMSSLPEFPMFAARQLNFDRLRVLDVVTMRGRMGPMPHPAKTDFSADPFGDELGQTSLSDKIVRSPVDWEAALRGVNSAFDGVIDATNTDDIGARMDAWKKVNSQARQVNSNLRETGSVGKNWLAGRSGRGRDIGEWVSNVVVSPNSSVHEASVRGATEELLLITSIALQRYKLQNGEYPERLEQLEPEFLDTVPTDLFSGNSLVYDGLAGDPFLLYSIGPNRKDDNGVHDLHDIPWDSDLLAVPTLRTVQDFIDAIRN